MIVTSQTSVTSTPALCRSSPHTSFSLLRCCIATSVFFSGTHLRMLFVCISLVPLCYQWQQVSEVEFNERWGAGVFDLLVEPGGRTGEDSGVIPSDDAYLLARFAAGIRSPRIGKLKLPQLGSFGCCADVPFPLLLRKAEATVAAAAAAARAGVI